MVCNAKPHSRPYDAGDGAHMRLEMQLTGMAGDGEREAGE